MGNFGNRGILGTPYLIVGTTVAKKLPNNLINADHYHGGESKFSVYAKVPALFKLITGYPWQVIKTLAVPRNKIACPHKSIIDIA